MPDSQNTKSHCALARDILLSVVLDDFHSVGGGENGGRCSTHSCPLLPTEPKQVYALQETQGAAEGQVHGLGRKGQLP